MFGNRSNKWCSYWRRDPLVINTLYNIHNYLSDHTLISVSCMSVVRLPQKQRVANMKLGMFETSQRTKPHPMEHAGPHVLSGVQRCNENTYMCDILHYTCMFVLRPCHCKSSSLPSTDAAQEAAHAGGAAPGADKRAAEEAEGVFRRKKVRLPAGHVWDEQTGTAVLVPSRAGSSTSAAPLQLASSAAILEGEELRAWLMQHPYSIFSLRCGAPFLAVRFPGFPR